jgi:hypothetical protein
VTAHHTSKARCRYTVATKCTVHVLKDSESKKAVARSLCGLYVAREGNTGPT